MSLKVVCLGSQMTQPTASKHWRKTES